MPVSITPTVTPAPGLASAPRTTEMAAWAWWALTVSRPHCPRELNAGAARNPSAASSRMRSNAADEMQPRSSVSIQGGSAGGSTIEPPPPPPPQGRQRCYKRQRRGAGNQLAVSGKHPPRLHLRSCPKAAPSLPCRTHLRQSGIRRRFVSIDCGSPFGAWRRKPGSLRTVGLPQGFLSRPSACRRFPLRARSRCTWVHWARASGRRAPDPVLRGSPGRRTGRRPAHGHGGAGRARRLRRELA